MRILVIHGAGMNMRGKVLTLPEYDVKIRAYAAALGMEVEIFHSNIEGEVINRLHAAHDEGIDEGTAGEVRRSARHRPVAAHRRSGASAWHTHRLGWVRPVSARERQEVSEYERQYEDGGDPRVFDVMDVPLLEARPKDYQQENWLLDPDNYWQRKGRLSWDVLGRLADPPAPLWIDGHSTYNGRNDRIPLAQGAGLTSSLRLIRVARLTLSVFMPGEAFGNPKRRVQGRFVHHGIDYRLWVTDPTCERTYLQKPDGSYDLGESYLTVSLGEPHNDACYKLVAAIMERGGS